MSSSTIKASIGLPVATRHRRDMTEKLLKATLNQNIYTERQKIQIVFLKQTNKIFHDPLNIIGNHFYLYPLLS